MCACAVLRQGTIRLLPVKRFSAYTDLAAHRVANRSASNYGRAFGNQLIDLVQS
jgi:hypothetical protein